ncbi:MAG: hypothetical protein HQL56_03615 [Magnetococcales bacterium]|nr:hypothetical protein [Magnetococcales bacterium]
MKTVSRLLIVPLLSLTVAYAAPAQSGGWDLPISDRLVQMSVDSLNQALKDSWRGSDLATSMADAEVQVKEKMAELGRLNKSIGLARNDGNRQELVFRRLAVQKELIGLQQQVVNYKVERAKAKETLLEKLLDRVRLLDRALTPREQETVRLQKAAAERMSGNSLAVEKAVFVDGGVRQTRYSMQSAQISRSMNQLTAAIAAHPQNRSSIEGGTPLTKAEWLTAQAVEAQGERQLAQLEQELLGLMAQKLALDARGLKEEMGGGRAGNEQMDDNDTAGMTNAFLDNN